MHVVPCIESLEGRMFLSASPEVIAADRAALAANQAALNQTVRERIANLSANRRALVNAIVDKARQAGLLRADLVQTALAQWRIISANQRANRAVVNALNADIAQDRKEILASSGDPTQQAVFKAELDAHTQQRNEAIANGRLQLRTDLNNTIAAFTSIAPQVQAFLKNAQPEIDALRNQIAQRNQFYADLIDEYRAKILASHAKLVADLRA